MKRVIIMLLIAAGPLLARGQDSASLAASRQEMEENYKSLKGQIENLIETKAAQGKQIEELRSEISSLRSQLAKPTGSFASQEDLKKVWDALEKLDKARIAGDEKLLTDVTNAMARLAKKLAVPVAAAPRTPPAATPTAPPAAESGTTPATSGADSGYWYVIKDGDTYRKIAKAYTDSGIKVTADQIEKANPTMTAAGLIVGKKVFIPAPKPAQTANRQP